MEIVKSIKTKIDGLTLDNIETNIAVIRERVWTDERIYLQPDPTILIGLSKTGFLFNLYEVQFHFTAYNMKC